MGSLQKEKARIKMKRYKANIKERGGREGSRVAASELAGAAVVGFFDPEGRKAGRRGALVSWGAAEGSAARVAWCQNWVCFFGRVGESVEVSGWRAWSYG